MSYGAKPKLSPSSGLNTVKTAVTPHQKSHDHLGQKRLLTPMVKLLLSAHKSLSMRVTMNDVLMEACYAPNIKIKGQTQCFADCRQRDLPELQY
jgi:hypothetical protein